MQTTQTLTNLNPVRYTVAAGDTLIVILPRDGYASSPPRPVGIGVTPSGGATVAVAHSFTPSEHIAAGLGVFTDWPDGEITVYAEDVLDAPATALRITVTVGGQAVVDLAF